MADIVDFNEPWDGRHSGDEIEKWLKQQIAKAQATANAKVGYIEYSGGLIAFYEDETKSNKIGEVVLSGNIYTVEITASEQSTFNVLSSETSKMVTFSAASTISTIGGTTPSPFVEDYSFAVSVDNGTGEFKEKQTGTIRSGSEASVNIRSWLTTGENRLRITVTGNESRQQATKIFTVNVTTLTLESNYKWHKPWIDGEDYFLDGLRFSGNLQKTLYIAIDGVENIIDQISFLPGDNYTSTNYSYNLAAKYNAAKNTENDWGWDDSDIHTVSFWMEGGGVSTKVFTYNFMFVHSSETGTAKLIVTNNVLEKATNFVEENLFDFAVYGVTSAVFNTEVGDGVGTPVTDTKTFSGLQTSTKYSYTSMLEYETTAVDGITLTVDAEIVTGETAFEMELPVDNSKAYQPTKGAYFYMNAASRNNSDVTNRLKFINQIAGADPESYTGTWTGFSFGDTDGWAVDNDNNRALVVKAGGHISMPGITPLSAAQNQSVTIEMKFKSDNIADYDTPVLSFTEVVNEGESDEKTLGIKLYPTRLTIQDSISNTDNIILRTVGLEEGEVHHILITFQRNYGNSHGNLCSIYIDGIRNIHFAYDGSAVFGGGNLEIGQDSTDFYLYMMRFYNSALESPQAVANFINTIVDGDEFTRAGVAESNNIIDNNNVDYEMAKKTGVNIMVVETNDTLPMYGNSSEYTCNLHLWFGSDNDARNFSVTKCRLSGQGTTSMSYYRWNLRVRPKDESVWSYGTGGTNTGKKGWFDGRNSGHPQVSDIVAKKNYASAMQGHKMGSVNLYDDLYKKVMASTTAVPSGARVAVYQYPVLGFQKFSDGTYQFIGLYTVGPHKGDKGTFGYDGKTYPMLMSLEGPNHAPLGTRFLHAWQNVDYSPSDETLTFGGEEGWDCNFAGGLSADDAGNKSTILAMYENEWKPAYEIVFFCSPYLIAFSDLSSDYNTVSKLNTNKETFRNGNTDGVSNSLFQVYDSSNYKLYAYNNASHAYVEVTGHDMLTYLSDYLGGVASPTTAQLIEARRQKFAAKAGDYWSVDSLVFHYCYCVLVGATDNFAKNMYPFKFQTLASGGRWEFRQDDLDTILDTDNNGQQTKKYSVLPGDKTETGIQIYQGGDSALYALVETAFGTNITNMMNTIVTKCAEIASELQITGTKLHETLFNVFDAYYWRRSAKYFPAMAYNKDTEWSYITPWDANPGQAYNGVMPLTQARGDAMYSEREWVKKHIAFIFSRYNIGGFTGQSADYGVFSLTPGMNYQFNFKPSIDLYPAATLGSGIPTKGARTLAGSTCAMSLGSNTGDTIVYILGADWYAEYGDLSGMSMASRGGSDGVGIDLSIVGKRLRKVKVGDSVAANVVFNAGGISFPNAPALEEFDARNVEKLGGTLDFSQCTRLRKVLLAGCKATKMTLPMGAQLTQLSLPDNLQTLFLHSLPTITNDSEDSTHVQLGITASLKTKIKSIYVNNCPLIDPIALLIELWTHASSVLQYITLIWNHEVEGDVDYFHALYYIAQNKKYVSGSGSSIVVDDVDPDKIYHEVTYENGVADNGNGTPIIEGTVIVDGYVSATEYEVVTNKWPNLHIQCSGRIIEFEDQTVKTICVNNWGGTTGGSTGIPGKAGEITMAQAAAVSSVGTAFRNNTEIEVLDLRAFVSSNLVQQSFQGMTNLKELYVQPNVTTNTGGDANLTNNTMTKMEKVVLSWKFERIKRYSWAHAQTATLIIGDAEHGSNLLSIASYYGIRDSFKNIVLYATTPPYWHTSDTSFAKSTSSAGSSCLPNNCKVYVPDSAVDAYKNSGSDMWGSFASRIYPISEWEG